MTEGKTQRDRQYRQKQKGTDPPPPPPHTHTHKQKKKKSLEKTDIRQTQTEKKNHWKRQISGRHKQRLRAFKRN